MSEAFDADAHKGNPYPVYAFARSTEPVFYSSRFGMWFVSRYDDVVQVLRDTTTFSSEDRSLKPKSWPAPVADIMARRRHAKHVGNVDPPAHGRLRQLLNPAFTPASVAGFEPMLRQIADDFIDRMVTNGDQGTADFVDAFAYPYPLTVILRLIGVPVADLDACMAWCQLKSALDFASETLSVDEQCVAAHASVEFVDYCEDLVRRRRAVPTDDLISRLLLSRAQGHEPMTEEEVSDLLPILIFAGHETTANLLAGLMSELLDDAAQLATLVGDGSHLRGRFDNWIEEALRFSSPALGFVRRATTDVQIGGTRIAAGDKLFLLYGSANHDERRWLDAEAFRPFRSPSASHIAFGYGIHFCVGAPLARLEARVGVEQLFARLPGLRLADCAAPREWTSNLVLRRLRSLHVVWR